MNQTVTNSDLLLLSLTNYYSKNKKHLDIFKHIVENDSKLSLRLIDWYVTNYCKEHNIAYVLTKGGKQEYFNVYMNYRSQLKAFKKVLFDPFRRRSRITFHYDKNGTISTTIGQLNFFRWAIENEIISNLMLHLQDVEKDMVKSQKTVLSKSDSSNSKNKAYDNGNATTTKLCAASSNGSKKKEHNVISKSSIKTMTKFKGSTLISFK